MIPIQIGGRVAIKEAKDFSPPILLLLICLLSQKSLQVRYVQLTFSNAEVRSKNVCDLFIARE